MSPTTRKNTKRNTFFFFLLLLGFFVVVDGLINQQRPFVTRAEVITFVSVTNARIDPRRRTRRSQRSWYNKIISSSSSSSSSFLPSSIIPGDRCWNIHHILLSANNEETTFTSNTTTKTESTTTQKRRTWDESYEILVEYYREHGDSNVPEKYKKDPKLGSWVVAQRRRQNRMPKDKVAKLDALDLVWDGEVVKKQRGDKNWEEFFQLLVQYKKENGHCNVSKYDKENKELAYWVVRQRSSKTNSVPSLTPYRIKKLDSIGFVWRLRASSERQSDKWDEQWNEKFEELVSFKKDHGHCNVPQVYEPNQPLADWVKTQRQMNAGTHFTGAVRSDRKERLDEIGFDWDFLETWDEAWLNMYNQLKKLQNVFAENNLDRQTWASAADQLELWNWEMNQQNLYTTGKLDPQREAMMEEIGYWKSIGLKRETTQISQ